MPRRNWLHVQEGRWECPRGTVWEGIPPQHLVRDTLLHGWLTETVLCYIRSS